MREIRSSRSVEGVVSNHDPYSDYLLTSLLHFFYTLSHGIPPRTRPHPPRSRRPLGLYRRSVLLRRKTPIAPRPPPRRHHLPRRTHHLLFPDRHLPPPQPRCFFPLLALLPLPKVTRSYYFLLASFFPSFFPCFLLYFVFLNLNSARINALIPSSPVNRKHSNFPSRSTSM